MKSLYDSALSGISKLMDSKIDSYTESKEVAIESLEAEKQAAEDAYQAQIDAIDNMIAKKQEIIDGIQDEIDAMREAREERQRQLDLQKAQYELERMQNQRTMLVYSEDKGMHYRTDESDIRDAKESVDNAKFEIEIAAKEKEIKLLEDEIDLLEKQKDALEDAKDASNKYYETLIKQQEKYWDSMIKNMEQQKSRWEELAEIQEIAEAYSAIEQVFGDMGYTVQDILNGNTQAFEDFKSRYIAIMSDMNQNTSFQEGLEYASGVAKENFGSIVSDAQGAAQELSQTFSDGTFSQAITQGVSDGIVSAKQELDKMDQLGKDAGDGLLNGWDEKSTLFVEAAKQTAQDAVEAFAEGQDSHSPSEKYKGLAGDAIDGLLLGVEENKQAFIDTIRSLAEDGLLAFEEGFNFENSALNTSFDGLKLLIESVTEALGLGTEGTVGGLLGALDQLSKFSFSEEGIVKQFDNLKIAIDSVTSAISGGGSSGGSKGGDASGSSSASMSAGAGGEGGSGSLVSAIDEFKSATDEALGGGGESGEGEGSGSGGTGAIPQFKELETAVNDVTTAIGSEESEGSESSGEGESDNLIGSIINLGETSTETLGESDGDGIIGKFNEFKGVIEEAANQVKSISEGLDEIDGKEVECTITVNVKMNGSIPAFASGTVLGNMQIESATYNAQYGKAFASGTIGLPKAEKNALVSEYGQTEMTVFPNGKTVITDEPTVMDLPKGTVIYNEEQTKKIMDNKVDASGNAHADGTDDSIWTTLADGTKVRPLQPGDKMYDLQQKFEAYFKSIDGNLEKLVPNSYYEQNREWNKLADQITYANSVVNNRNVQPVINVGDVNVTCPGVTSQEVMREVGDALGKQIGHLAQRAIQEQPRRY